MSFAGPLFRGEGEMCVGIVAIYAIFGLLQLECGNELTCGVVVLSFQARYIYIYIYYIYVCPSRISSRI